MTHEYALHCCQTPVAVVTVTNGAAPEILNPDGTEPHRMIGWFSVDDHHLNREARELVGDDLHSAVMAGARDHPVTEIVWETSATDAHRSWTICCLECGRQQLEITESNLSRLAHLLTSGDWSATDGVPTLGVLNKAMTRSGI
jgi:hypothetical protein